MYVLPGKVRMSKLSQHFNDLPIAPTFSLNTPNNPRAQSSIYSSQVKPTTQGILPRENMLRVGRGLGLGAAGAHCASESETIYPSQQRRNPHRTQSDPTRLQKEWRAVSGRFAVEGLVCRRCRRPTCAGGPSGGHVRLVIFRHPSN